MLFHSREFLFFFLPAVYLVWLACVYSRNQRFSVLWLTFASLLFYAYWNPSYLVLLLTSIGSNFGIGMLVDPNRKRSFHIRKWSLIFGIAANLGLLGYAKYANFFVDTVNQVFSTGWTFDNVILPLAISFYTFQQIAYLIDSHQGKVCEHNLLNYVFFVSFFPQLIAGPIVHHSEIYSQINRGFSFRNISLQFFGGISIFLLGLFKKVVLADSCGELATPVFDAPLLVAAIHSSDAWAGVLGYAFQIYFDFSGYSDMAIGLAFIFGIQLPDNFQSPYRATNIIDFWRRWHITLSQFLKNYLYIPLGGNRKGFFIRYRNLFITMLLGGLWHGAGWPFVIWGALHGLYLITNHLWREFRPLKTIAVSKHLAVAFGWMLTFSSVTLAWVFFRAPDLPSALALITHLFGNSASLPAMALSGDFINSYLRWPFLALLTGICLGLPTTRAYFQRLWDSSIKDVSLLSWKPNPLHGCVMGFLLFCVVRKYYTLAPTEFLYFNF